MDSSDELAAEGPGELNYALVYEAQMLRFHGGALCFRGVQLGHGAQ